MQGSIVKIININGVNYRLLDYIESTGTQYFYSNIEAGFNVVMQYDLDITAVGGQNGTGQLLFGLNGITEDIGTYIARVGKNGTPVSVSKEVGRHTFILDAVNSVFSIDGTETSVTKGSTPDTTNMPVLARRDGITDGYFVEGKLYGAKFWKSNVLVRDYIPVERVSDNKIGMLDLVSGELFVSRVGDFIKGNYIKVEHIYKPKLKAKTYEILEYIENDGDQYIDTGISNYTGLRVEIDMSISNVSSMKHIGACQQSGSTYYRFHFGSSTLAKWSVFMGTQSAEISGSDTNRHTFSLDQASRRFKVDNKSVIISSGGGLPSISFWLMNRNGIGSAVDGKLYGFKAYRNDKEFMNLIPVKRLKDNVIGMIDTYTNTFYTNGGTGNFTSKALATPQYYYEEVEEVEYIESSGTQFIDTGIAGNTISKLEIKCYMTVDPSSLKAFGIIDEITSSNFKRLHIGVSGGNIYSLGLKKDAVTTSRGQADPPQPVIIDIANNKYTINGTQYSITATGEYPTSTFRFFGRNSNVSTRQDMIAMKLYYAKFYVGGVLAKDFVPVKYGTEYCILDLVENKLYHNNGTGSFIGGNRVEVKKISQIIIDNGTKYYKLDYLENTAQSYIDLGIGCDEIKNVEIDFMGTSWTSDQVLYGSFTQAIKGSNYTQISSNTAIYGNGSAKTLKTGKPTINKKYKIKSPVSSIGTAYLYEGGEQVGSVAIPTANRETLPMMLFTLNLNGSASSTHYTKMKVYSFKGWGLDDKLLFDLVPVEKVDGTKGMLNLVNHTFYENSGTGAFTGNKREIMLVE